MVGYFDTDTFSGGLRPKRTARTDPEVRATALSNDFLPVVPVKTTPPNSFVDYVVVGHGFRCSLWCLKVCVSWEVLLIYPSPQSFLVTRVQSYDFHSTGSLEGSSLTVVLGRKCLTLPAKSSSRIGVQVPQKPLSYLL